MSTLPLYTLYLFLSHVWPVGRNEDLKTMYALCGDRSDSPAIQYIEHDIESIFVKG